MAEKMASGGFNKNRLKTLCNFIAPEMAERYRKIDNTTPQERDYYCYVGRLSEEKGIATLLKAASELPYKFKVAGDGPLGDELRRKFGACSNIEFLGMLSSEDVKTLLYGARFSVMPSECYENNPLGVIESFCAGTPVVGASIGGIDQSKPWNDIPQRRRRRSGQSDQQSVGHGLRPRGNTTGSPH